MGTRNVLIPPSIRYISLLSAYVINCIPGVLKSLSVRWVIRFKNSNVIKSPTIIVWQNLLEVMGLGE